MEEQRDWTQYYDRWRANHATERQQRFCNKIKEITGVKFKRKMTMLEAHRYINENLPIANRTIKDF